MYFTNSEVTEAQKRVTEGNYPVYSKGSLLEELLPSPDGHSPPGWCGQLALGHRDSSNGRTRFEGGIFCHHDHVGASGSAAAAGGAWGERRPLWLPPSADRTGVTAAFHRLPGCEQGGRARPCLHGLPRRQGRLGSAGGIPELTGSQT